MKQPRLYLLEEWNKLVSVHSERIVFDSLIIEVFKNYFYLGAYTLYERLMNVMDSDREPTKNDLEFMSDIHHELTQHINKLREQGIVKPR